jgi:hypothetical protein
MFPVAIFALLAAAIFAGVLDSASFWHCEHPLGLGGNSWIALTPIAGATVYSTGAGLTELRGIASRSGITHYRGACSSIPVAQNQQAL